MTARRGKATARLVTLAGEAMNAQIAMQAAEADYKAKKARFRDLMENIIPEALDAEELDVAVLPTGDLMSTDEKTFGSITAEHRAEAYHWLRNNGQEGMIKTQLVVPFKLRDKRVESVTQVLQEALPDVKIEVKETVPGSTLLSFIRTMLDAGADWPADLFGAVRVRQAVLPGVKNIRPEIGGDDGAE